MQKVEEKSLSETTFAVLDLETSGGSPRLGAGITEIGVVKVKGGEILGTFQSFVDPGHSLPVFITQLTGISDEMLISAPFIDEILPTLFEFLGSAEETVVVAHNSPFDLSFLKAASKTHEIQWPEYLTVDTARLARAVLDRDEVINCKLSTWLFFLVQQLRPITVHSMMPWQRLMFCMDLLNALQDLMFITLNRCEIFRHARKELSAQFLSKRGPFAD
jgi:DNA polymerase-3 subunit epsilon